MKKTPKYLLRKISGSRARYTYKPDYADARHTKHPHGEELPLHESMKKRGQTRMDTTLVKRWLYSKVGQDFDDIYAEFLTRLQPQHRDAYRSCIFWYVEPRAHITFREHGEIWGKREGRPERLPHSIQSTFFVHPETNILYTITGYDAEVQD